MNNSKTQAIRSMAIGTAVVLGFGVAAASADPSSQYLRDGTHTYVVRFADLDINKIDGAAALYRRLQQAAGIVCHSLQSRELAMNTEYKACKDRAVADAVTSVGAPVLSQYHESRPTGAKQVKVQLASAQR